MPNSDITVVEYHVYSVVSLMNAHFFIYVLIKHAYLFKSNVYAIIVLLCMILFSLEPFWMLDMTLPFASNCYDHSNKCTRCINGGYLQTQLVRIAAISKLLMLIKILEVNFQSFKFLAYPKGFIIGLKFVAIALFISPTFLTIFGVLESPKFILKTVDSTKTKHVCRLPKSEFSESVIFKRNVYGAFYIGCIIVCWIAFIHRTIRLYHFRREKTRVFDTKKMRQNIKIMAHGIFMPILRQTILVSMMIIAVLLTLFSHQVWLLQPFAGFLAGSCVILMFSQKEKWLQWFWRRLEEGIIEKWILLQLASLAQSQQTTDEPPAEQIKTRHNMDELQANSGSSNDNQESSPNRPNIDVVPMNAAADYNNSKNRVLTAIMEDEVTLTLPEWSPISPLHHEEQEQLEEKQNEEIKLDSLTQSDILTAMRELDCDSASITNTV